MCHIISYTQAEKSALEEELASARIAAIAGVGGVSWATLYQY